jgi:8-oxo-dGTP diphosphatase
MEARNAAKAFVVHDGKLLIVKREPKNVQTPGIWEIPGGRLEIGEDPMEGVKREMLEETGLSVEVVMPFSVRHFTRKDGQVITMIIFLCKSVDDKIKLSEEHTHFEWVQIKKAKEKISDFYYPEVERFLKMELKKHL